MTTYIKAPNYRKPRIRIEHGVWTAYTRYEDGPTMLVDVWRAQTWCSARNKCEGRDDCPPAEPRTCMTCRHSEPDSDYNFCIKCERDDDTEYSNWEAYE